MVRLAWRTQGSGGPLKFQIVPFLGIYFFLLPCVFFFPTSAPLKLGDDRKTTILSLKG